MSSSTAAFKIASFLKALRCRSAGKPRLLPVRHSPSVSLLRKLAIKLSILTLCDTNVKRYYAGLESLSRRLSYFHALPIELYLSDALLSLRAFLGFFEFRVELDLAARKLNFPLPWLVP